MSGYARRPGAPPLSRARSLVVPDAAAFYERRSCLPQLDCERPHGGDLHPHFFGIRPTFMCYVPSPVLASVGDTDFGYGKGKCTKQGPAGAHETHFGDDKLEDLEEANPFSFKEFLKTKNLGLTKDDTTNSRIYPKEASRHSLGLDHSSPTPQTVGYGLEYQQPFFEDPTGAGDIVGEEEEDEDSGWNGAYLPSAVEKTHSSRPTSFHPTGSCPDRVQFSSRLIFHASGPEKRPDPAQAALGCPQSTLASSKARTAGPTALQAGRPEARRSELSGVLRTPHFRQSAAAFPWCSAPPGRDFRCAALHFRDRRKLGIFGRLGDRAAVKGRSVSKLVLLRLPGVCQSRPKGTRGPGEQLGLSGLSSARRLLGSL
uniref:serologically defined colon cancer antigen 3 n=1 Tax=Urocitellus parryii TaxID=9999 RepID=UPI000E55A1B9|nr:serologically defined colon cancer antigen 3 [Urocitellus parryii]